MSTPNDPIPTDRRADSPALPGTQARRRVMAALRHPSRNQLMSALLVGLLGFAMVTQVTSYQARDAYSGLRASELVQVLNGLNVENRRAEQEVSKLEKDKDRLLNSTRKSQVAVDAAKEEAITLGILAGTLPAQGPGLRITVTNQANRLTLNHLLDGIQELRDAGAEAMEFNDTVRVVASTWFDSNESGIVVDGRRLSSPYIIDVIGDPETLGPALQVPGGFVFDVESDQGTVKIEQLDKVVVGSIITLKSPDFAQPDSGQ
ncbi:MAG: DUF881 domain-containing protein [Marmoricola sp.]|jgi:uncharacterized protein YlxW (UPF0749 family)